MASKDPVAPIALTLCILAEALLAVGVSTAYWIVASDNSINIQHLGLWMRCYRTHCDTVLTVDEQFQAMRSMALLGLVAGLVAIVLMIVYIVKQLKPVIGVAFFAAGSAAAAVGVCFVLFLVWYSLVVIRSPNYALSWSFAVSVAAAGLFGLADIFILVAACRKPRGPGVI